LIRLLLGMSEHKSIFDNLCQMQEICLELIERYCDAEERYISAELRKGLSEDFNCAYICAQQEYERARDAFGNARRAFENMMRTAFQRHSQNNFQDYEDIHRYYCRFEEMRPWYLATYNTGINNIQVLVAVGTGESYLVPVVDRIELMLIGDVPHAIHTRYQIIKYKTFPPHYAGVVSAANRVVDTLDRMNEAQFTRFQHDNDGVLSDLREALVDVNKELAESKSHENQQIAILHELMQCICTRYISEGTVDNLRNVAREFLARSFPV
jgi:hypothetical protein